MEALLPVRRPMSGVAWKTIRTEVLTCCSEWDGILIGMNDDEEAAEELFAKLQARIAELEQLSNGQQQKRMI